MMGEFDFKALQDESPRVAALYFALFYIIINAVWLNLVTSIIAESYDQCWDSRFKTEDFAERIQHDEKVANWGETAAPFKQFFVQIWKSLLWGTTNGRSRSLLWGKHFWERYAITLEKFESSYIDEVMWAYCDLAKIEAMGDPSVCVYSKQPDRHTTYEFISDSVGNEHRFRFLEYFCVSIPAVFTQLPLAYEWTKMLTDYNNWKNEQPWIATAEADPIEQGIDAFLAKLNERRIRRTATPDAATPDAATPDTATPDAATPDAATPDTATPDAATPDTATPDAATPDAATPDTATPDAATPDAATPDAATPDAATPDAATPDTATPDAATPDTATPDAANEAK